MKKTGAQSFFYYPSRGNSIFSFLLAVLVTATLAVVSAEIFWVSVTFSLLTIWIIVYNTAKAFTWFRKGPQGWFIDQNGIWYGRRSTLKLMGRWAELESVEPWQRNDENPVFSFKFSNKTVRVNLEEVSLPAGRNFEADLKEVLPRGRNSW